jgi:hypothetical protein
MVFSGKDDWANAQLSTLNVQHSEKDDSSFES